MMHLAHLEHLLAVVELGSIRAASRRLDVRQPALTRSIAALERALGGPLFTRERSGMVLNETGYCFHARAAMIVNEARQAKDEFRQRTQGESAGSVTACLSIAPHLGMFPHTLRPFRQRYPRVNLQIIEGT